MDHPAVHILLLEQGNCCLEDPTKDFVFLAPMTHYPDSSLCSFYRTGLNSTTRAQLFAAYIEWVLVSSRSSRTMEDDTSPNQPIPQLAESEPEPTADGQPEPRATEPLPLGVLWFPL
ncbi:hypothetical protein M9458_033221, partial [Cirrhinus mrigala]